MILSLSLALAAEPPAPTPAPSVSTPPATTATTPAPAPAKKPWFINTGELRLIGSLPPADLVVDLDGDTLGQGPVLDSRLRDGSTFTWKGVEANLEFDLFNAQIAGDAWDIRGDEDARHRESVDPLGPDWARLRKLSLGGRIGPMLVEGGVTTSHWGLGMLANDGAHDPEFGRSDFGDRVIRLRVATQPIADQPLFVAIAGDRVLDDENATWDPLEGEGAAAWQGIATVIYGAKDHPRVGIYGVYRDQMETDAVRHTQVGVVDVYADAPVATPAANLRFAAEGATIFGRTSRASSYNSRDGLDVLSGGATALVEARMRPLPLRVALRGGWSSGDADPYDGASGDFTFDRDFDAGMVLFDELQGAIDAASYAELSDLENAGQAPDGAETLVGEGAFRHAIFAQPVVEVTPLPWLSVKAGFTAAWSTRPVEEPYASFRAGGVPTNQLGQATSGYDLGTEVDWAVKLGDVRLKPNCPAMPALLVQGGHAFAADNLGGGTVTLLTAAARLRW